MSERKSETGAVIGDLKGKVFCPVCYGKGWFAEHDNSPFAHDADGGCTGSCPVQVECHICESTGYVKVNNGDR